jgi:hypothetical protein
MFISSGLHQGVVSFFHAALFRKGWPFAPTDVVSAETLFNLLTLKPCTIRPRVTSRFHVIVTQTPEALHYQVSLLFHESAICWPNLMFPTGRCDTKRLLEASKAYPVYFLLTEEYARPTIRMFAFSKKNVRSNQHSPTLAALVLYKQRDSPA